MLIRVIMWSRDIDLQQLQTKDGSAIKLHSFFLPTIDILVLAMLSFGTLHVDARALFRVHIFR